jgi:hypothetical protein
VSVKFNTLLTVWQQVSKYKDVFWYTFNTSTSFLDASKGSTWVWQNAVEELGHCNTHYLNCRPFRLLKIKISLTKYVPRSCNIFCKQVNGIQFRQWIFKWPNFFTVFLPSTCTITVNKYGTDDYDNSVLKCTLYSLWHVLYVCVERWLDIVIYLTYRHILTMNKDHSKGGF